MPILELLILLLALALSYTFLFAVGRASRCRVRELPCLSLPVAVVQLTADSLLVASAWAVATAHPSAKPLAMAGTCVLAAVVGASGCLALAAARLLRTGAAPASAAEGGVPCHPAGGESPVGGVSIAIPRDGARTAPARWALLAAPLAVEVLRVVPWRKVHFSGLPTASLLGWSTLVPAVHGCAMLVVGLLLATPNADEWPLEPLLPALLPALALGAVGLLVRVVLRLVLLTRSRGCLSLRSGPSPGVETTRRLSPRGSSGLDGGGSGSDGGGEAADPAPSGGGRVLTPREAQLQWLDAEAEQGDGEAGLRAVGARNMMLARARAARAAAAAAAARAADAQEAADAAVAAAEDNPTDAGKLKARDGALARARRAKAAAAAAEAEAGMAEDAAAALMAASASDGPAVAPPRRTARDAALARARLARADAEAAAAAAAAAEAEADAATSASAAEPASEAKRTARDAAIARARRARALAAAAAAEATSTEAAAAAASDTNLEPRGTAKEQALARARRARVAAAAAAARATVAEAAAKRAAAAAAAEAKSAPVALARDQALVRARLARAAADATSLEADAAERALATAKLTPGESGARARPETLEETVASMADEQSVDAARRQVANGAARNQFLHAAAASQVADARRRARIATVASPEVSVAHLSPLEAQQQWLAHCVEAKGGVGGGKVYGEPERAAPEVEASSWLNRLMNQAAMRQAATFEPLPGVSAAMQRLPGERMAGAPEDADRTEQRLARARAQQHHREERMGRARLTRDPPGAREGNPSVPAEDVAPTEDGSNVEAFGEQ